VATSGSYTDLSDKPTIPSAQVNSDWSSTGGISEILNKPTIPTLTSELTNDSNFVVDAAYVHTDNNLTNAIVNQANYYSTTKTVNMLSDLILDSAVVQFLLNMPTTLIISSIEKENFNYMIVCVCNSTITVPATSGTTFNMSGNIQFPVTTAAPLIIHVLKVGNNIFINAEENK
jgi:hypothetical protein